MEAKARLSSVQVSGVLTARLSSGTGCVKVASISRRNCCLSAGRLSVSLASAKAFARASGLLWAVVYFVLPCCRSESGTTHCCFILLIFFRTDPKSAFPAEIESAKAIQWSFMACAMILLQSLLAAFILSWVSAFWSLEWCLYITHLSLTASSHSLFHQGLLFDRESPPPVTGIASLAASRMEETIRRFTSSRSSSPTFISEVPRRFLNKSQLARS